VESGLREGIQSDLLSPEILYEIERETRRGLKAHRRTARLDPKRVAAAEEEIGNLVEAFATGKLRGSQGARRAADLGRSGSGGHEDRRARREAAGH